MPVPPVQPAASSRNARPSLLVRLRPVLFTIAPALVALAVVILALFGDNGLLRRHQLRRQLYAVESEVQRLQTENQELRRRIELLQRSPEELERKAADKLLMAPPGSTIYRFPDAPPEKDPTAPTP